MAVLSCHRFYGSNNWFRLKLVHQILFKIRILNLKQMTKPISYLTMNLADCFLMLLFTVTK